METKDIKIANGEFKLKIGRKTIAEIHHSPTFFAGTKVYFNPETPYCLSFKCPSVARHCKDLEEVVFYINKFVFNKETAFIGKYATN